MTEAIELPELLPGDHLLYGASDLFGFITRLKTWSPAVHIEIYAGDRITFASRNDHGARGVNVYPIRTAGLIAVLRPRQAFDFERARRWFYAEAIGQAYDWKGLLCFTLAVKQGATDRMFCSEFATRFDREARIDSFNPNFDADQLAPAQFPMSPAFDWYWKKAGVRF